MKGMSLSIEEKEYRCGALIAAAKCNVPLICIKYISEWANVYAKMTVCEEKNLIRSYIGMVLGTLIQDM